MRRPPAPPQLDLFPDFSAPAPMERRLALPFQQKEAIDLQRAERIFNLHHPSIRRMLERKLIRGYRLDKRSPWRIEYDSVVEYCDQLILHHAIPDRRPRAAPGRRRRDSDLLPFPAEETISVPQVCARLDCTQEAVRNLIESGDLVAYQVIIGAGGCPWRIHIRSLERYMASLLAMAAPSTSTRHRTSTR